MRRDQLEHVIRASGGILGEDELIVIGSQAILASVSEGLPEVVTRSIEVDILPLDDPDETKATLVEGSIGAGSLFQQSFGIYAQGVGQRTARLPAGWRQRLVPLGNENTRGVTALCLEPHDLLRGQAARSPQPDPRTSPTSARCWTLASCGARSSVLG